MPNKGLVFAARRSFPYRVISMGSNRPASPIGLFHDVFLARSDYFWAAMLSSALRSRLPDRPPCRRTPLYFFSRCLLRSLDFWIRPSFLPGKGGVGTKQVHELQRGSSQLAGWRERLVSRQAGKAFDRDDRTATIECSFCNRLQNTLFPEPYAHR